jgi:hypothetical protein
VFDMITLRLVVPTDIARIYVFPPRPIANCFSMEIRNFQKQPTTKHKLNPGVVIIELGSYTNPEEICY